jgi:hypothetical protein
MTRIWFTFDLPSETGCDTKRGPVVYEGDVLGRVCVILAQNLFSLLISFSLFEILS